MSEFQKLTHPPAVEAILDVQGAFPNGVQIEALAALHESFQKNYPKRTEEKIFQLGFDFQAGQELRATAQDHGLRGYRFHSPDEKEIVQCRKDGFTFNRLKPYTAWEDVYPRAVEAWGVFRKAFPDMVISRVSLRYINQIFLPCIDGLVELDDYLAIQLPGPKNLDLTRAAFMGQSIFGDAVSGLAANYVVTQQPASDANKVCILLDIDVFYAGPELSETNPPALWEKMRYLKNKLFFGSLNEKGIALFQ